MQKYRGFYENNLDNNNVIGIKFKFSICTKSRK